MTDYEEEKARLSREMGQKAITLAMQSRWQEAIAVNQSIIESMPTDANAYNRLGRAFMELGEYGRAKEAYSSALALAPHNAIAKKNLGRLSNLKETQTAVKKESRGIDLHLFVSEVGKTGVVDLYQLAAKEVVARLVAGAPVYLKARGQQLIAETEQGEYLGVVAPQRGSRLVKMIEAGNQYTAAVVSLDENRVKIIIREVFQHPSQVGRLSFPVKPVEGFRPHIKDTLLRDGIGEESEDADLEDEGEDLLPEGFSIFETGVPMGDVATEEEFMQEG